MHVSVLLAESIDGLRIREDGVYVDATYGAGGHSRAILEHLGPAGRLVGIDVDPSVHARTAPADPRLTLVQANFRTLGDALAEHAIEAVDGVLFDFGVSSMQLDNAERGFSFQTDAPLDMRMDPTAGLSVADYLAETEENEIADAIFLYGEERASRRIARAIKRNLPKTTLELARLVSGTVHRPGKRERTHPATKTFQALRIAVNDELRSIEDGVDAAIAALRPGGRVAAISFHSLEDRIVKTRFRDDERLTRITRKPIVPTDEECATNPRSRSAKLRVAERLEDHG